MYKFPNNYTRIKTLLTRWHAAFLSSIKNTQFLVFNALKTPKIFSIMKKKKKSKFGDILHENG